MIQYIVAIFFVMALSSPDTTVSWLPPSVTANERNEIRAGLEQTKRGIQDTGGAVVNTILRIWMDSDKDKNDV